MGITYLGGSLDMTRITNELLVLIIETIFKTHDYVGLEDCREELRVIKKKMGGMCWVLLNQWEYNIQLKV